MRATASSFVPTAAPGSRKLRVLCVHGFRTNAAIMKDQMVGLRHAMGTNVEYVYLNAPFTARGKPHKVVEDLYARTAPFYEWWQGRYLGTNAVADGIEDIVSSKTDTWNLVFEDLDESLLYMEAQLCRLGPFDVAVGFSQGATMLTIFSMWAMQKRRTRWWALTVCFSGVRVHGINCRELFEDASGRAKLVPIPSIHVAGTTDSIYYESLELTNMYEAHPKGSVLARTLMEHDGAHRFPQPRKFAPLYARLAQLVHQFFQFSSSSLSQTRARL